MNLSIMQRPHLTSVTFPAQLFPPWPFTLPQFTFPLLKVTSDGRPSPLQDNGKFLVLLSLDLSAAFDMVAPALLDATFSQLP